MLPVSLSIEGLYSYQKKQVIEFDELLEGQLFGIFGAVGSGKTAILEAISLALYGESERLGGQDKRSYNILNLQSDSYKVSFEFNVDDVKYLFEYTGERNKKKFDTVKTDRIGYKWNSTEFIPLDSVDQIVDILGLTYENFKRTVIIPQGKFQEFIHLTAKPRTQMLKDLFNLHKFELDIPTKSLIKQNTSAIDILTGKLSHHELISEETILKLQSSLNTLNEEFQIKKTEYGLSYKELSEIEDFYKKGIALSKIKSERNQLLEQKQAFDTKEESLKIYEETFKLFSVVVNDIDRLNKENLIKTTADLDILRGLNKTLNLK